MQVHRFRAGGHRGSGRAGQLLRSQWHGRMILAAATAIEARLQALDRGVHPAMLASTRFRTLDVPGSAGTQVNG